MKIGIVGSGLVGATAAYALLMSGTGREIVLADTEAEVFAARPKICDLGYLRTAYRTETGKVGYRCPAEPVDTYVKKGGELEETIGRKCLCNALMADVGVGQRRPSGAVEQPLLTSGDELRRIGEFTRGRLEYSAVDVIEYLLSGLAAASSDQRYFEAASTG